MEKPKFVYVTYIRTTPEKLWNALTDPKFTRQYFFDSYQESAWKPAAPWKMVFSNGQLAVSGEVLVIDPPRKLVLSWKSESKHQEEAPARMTYTLEKQDDQVKLTVLHESDVPNSKVIDSVSNGWPMVLASLKSLLETGRALEITSCCPADGECAATPKEVAAATR
jgi:uncharacterized protein YndB with AHSA1/START domain